MHNLQLSINGQASNYNDSSLLSFRLQLTLLYFYLGSKVLSNDFATCKVLGYCLLKSLDSESFVWA